MICFRLATPLDRWTELYTAVMITCAIQADAVCRQRNGLAVHRELTQGIIRAG
jgi:hypothetical protein